MIVSCPNCAARFVVDAAALGATGRQVRCGRCKETWFQGPAEPESIRIQETVPEFIIRPRTPGAQLPAVKPRRKPRNTRLVGWLMLLVLLIGALVVAWYNRVAIVQQVPALAGIFEGVQPPPPASPTDGLDIPRDKITFNRDGNVITVAGIVQNRTDRERPVPRLKLTIKDSGGKVLLAQSFEAKQATAPANGKVDYEIKIDNLPPEASLLSVEFDHATP
jgi:predicted Zn finger-like uncharacterized protein